MSTETKSPFEVEFVHDGYAFLKESSLPVLVLALNGEHDATRNPFVTPERWLRIDQQAAGIGCHHHRLWATPLPIREEKLTAARALAEHYLDSCVGAFGVSLDDFEEYRVLLNDLLGVTVNRAWRRFEEAIYPVELTAENWHALTTEPMPEDFDELIEWSPGLDRLLGCLGRWELLILGPNCD